MGPHEILRVRGGQPMMGGPVLTIDEPYDEVPPTGDLPETETFSYIPGLREIKERIIHAGLPQLPGEPKLVLRPLPIRSLHNEENQMEESEPAVSEPNFIATVPKSVTVSQPQSFDPDDFLICTDGVTKSYLMGKVVVPVLKGVNLGIREGEFLAIVGQSGSGKSTLLHLLGTLDTPDQGTIHFDGQRIDNIASGQRDILRNRFIGMIFQFYHLLPELSVLENVLSPLMIRDSVWSYFCNRSRYHKKGRELLDAVGLSHRLTHKPNELSGGEMQRAAIARALISEPQMLLADEPTGNLDAQSAQEILHLLRDLNRERRLTIVMVTHDLGIAKQADRMISIYDGQVR